MKDLILFLTLSALGFGLSALNGYRIGKKRGHAGAGFWLGLVFSWVGWLIAAHLPMTPKAQAIRNIKVAREESRLGGRPGQRPLVPLDSPKAKLITSALTSLRAFAATDPAQATLARAVERFSTDVQPVRALSGWFFSDGPRNLVGSLDGLIYLVGTDNVTKVSSARPIIYDLNVDGTISAIVVEGFTPTNLRPAALAHAFVTRNGQRSESPLLMPATPATRQPDGRKPFSGDSAAGS